MTPYIIDSESLKFLGCLLNAYGRLLGKIHFGKLLGTGWNLRGKKLFSHSFLHNLWRESLFIQQTHAVGRGSHFNRHGHPSGWVHLCLWRNTKWLLAPAVLHRSLQRLWHILAKVKRLIMVSKVSRQTLYCLLSMYC